MWYNKVLKVKDFELTPNGDYKCFCDNKQSEKSKDKFKNI